MGKGSFVATLVLGAVAAPVACAEDQPTKPPASAGVGGDSSRAGTSGTGAGTGGVGTAGAGTGGAGAGGAGTGGAGAASESGAAGESGSGGDSCAGGAGGCADEGEPPSCASLSNSCGPSGTDDCCAATLVPATTVGPFSRGNDPAYPATISDFRLDKYEATVGRFRAFVAAFDTGWRPAPGSGKNENDPVDAGWQSETWDVQLPSPDVETGPTGVLCDSEFQTWTHDPGTTEAESRPINCLTWYLAYAFCIWDGGRLPTEAEWNYAAAGGGDALGWRQYPWSEPSSSTAIDETHASYYSTDCHGDGAAGCSRDDIVVVGSMPRGNGRWGHADLGGNVGEWTNDLYDEYPVPCANCANHELGADRTFRGGSYDNEALYLLTSHRRGRSGKHTAANVGVRCARSPI
jgi:formylglycine-generating enzyme required for sulfatase activity